LSKVQKKIDSLELMFYNVFMDTLGKLKMLSDQMSLEPAEEDRRTTALVERRVQDICVQPAMQPNGGRILLLKTLLTSACERDCYYCPFRAGRDFRRATFSPDEFAQLFYSLAKAKVAEGVFLSSGIAGGGIRTQDQLLATAEILRKKLGFKGYIHLKIMPGAEKAQVEQAMRLANRVSINLEAPNKERLSRLAPHKIFIEELVRSLRWVDEIRQSSPANRTWNGRWPSLVTQFVAGGSDESDVELLHTTDWLMRNLHLARAYFSAFNPIPDTPLEAKPATDPLREHRLYQASFLLRDYGFSLEELPFEKNGHLPLPVDPKSIWARENLLNQPVEINKANRNQLLRIPGIGPKGADSILQARRSTKLNDLAILKKLGIVSPNKAAPFLLLNGRRPAFQLPLI
jgi:predicted DNA-binding helix-hairpin-helix protein